MGGFGQDFEERFNWQNKGVEDSFNGKRINPPTPLPEPGDTPTLAEEMEKAKKDTFLQESIKKGRKSTFLSSARGDTQDVPTVGKPTLGG